MQIVAHRINTVERLRRLPTHWGVELDLRADGSELILNHDPFKGGERFVDYLAEYRHGLLVLNIKEAGIEDEVLRLVRARGVTDCFLLDVEFPYLYRAARKGERAIAVRYSEDECIETVLKYKGRVDWVWIDTISKLPLDAKVVEQLRGFKTCLVCPERWGRPQDIPSYRKQLAELGLQIDAVMTAEAHVAAWLT
jgi:hypothetical protein